MPMTQSGPATVSVVQVAPSLPASFLTGDRRRAFAGPWWLADGGISAANCLAAYQPKGAASYAASKINLAHPGTFNAAEGVAPTWNAVNGWTGDGSTMYLTTGIVGATQAYSIIVQFKNANSGGVIIGASDTSNTVNLDLAPNDSVGHVGYDYGASGGVAAPVLTSGNLCLAGPNAYRNGVLDAVFAANIFTIDEALYLLAKDDGINGADTFNSGSIVAAAVYNMILSAALVSTLQMVMAAL